MKWYIARLIMQSASGTLWQADTIFGHLCWALRFLEGEKKLGDFLELYKGDKPPFLLSNGFPGEMLPRPLISPSPVSSTFSLTEQMKHFYKEKDLKNVSHISRQDFERMLLGKEFDPEIYKSDKDKYSKPATRSALKNQLNRLTGTTGGGGQLFSFEEHCISNISIYLKIKDGFEEVVKKIFNYLKDTGYGKRKSVGYGQIKEMTFEPFSGFASPADANGFVSLSNFVPAENDPVQGYWKLIIKYGKLSEGFATETNVFKKPLLMMEAGSTFYDSPVKDYYGHLVKGLAKDHDEVVQYAFALPVPMKLPLLQ